MPRNTQAGRNALGIKYFTEGPPALVGRLNEILRGMDSLYLRNSGDILGNVTPDGTFARLRSAPSVAPSSRSAAAPFTVIDASTVAAGVTTLKIRVTPGMVNSCMPKIAGAFLTATPAPTLTIPASSTRWITVKATMTNFGQIKALEVIALATDPFAYDEEGEPNFADTPTTFHYVLAVVTSTASELSIQQTHTGNLGLGFYNRLPVWYPL